MTFVWFLALMTVLLLVWHGIEVMMSEYQDATYRRIQTCAKMSCGRWAPGNDAAFLFIVLLMLWIVSISW